MASKTWQGGSDNWTANPNTDWSPSGQPTSTDDVTVASGDPQINSNVGTIDSLTDSATVDIVTGGVLDVTTTLSNTGNVDVDSDGYTGGSSTGPVLTVGGTFTNSGNFNVGNGGNTSAPVTVNLNALTNTVGLSTGTINLNGNNGSTPEAVSVIVNSTAGFGTGTTLTGNINLANNASIQFTGGSISAIAGQSELTLNGANTSIYDSGLGANSALSGLNSVIGQLTVENGSTLATTVALTNTGTIGVDDNGYTGGSTLTIGGTLTNASSTAAGTLNIGNGALSGKTSVTIDGGLTNFAGTETGTINVTGTTGTTPTAAVLNIDSSAGFGTAGQETGTINLNNDAQIQFKGASGTGTSNGTINTIRGSVYLNGADAAISSDGTDTNSALAGLNTIGTVGSLKLENGNAVTTTGSLTNQNFLGVDDNGYTGGSSLTLGTTGKLTNEGTLNIGNGALSAATTVSVGTGGLANYGGSAVGTINVTGATNALASLNVNATAGFGTGGVLAGTVRLNNDAQIQFASGSISSIIGTLNLSGAGASVLDKGGSANSALSGLSSVSGTFTIENGPTVSTSATAGLANTGYIGVDDGGYTGGSTLSVTNTLTNSGTLAIGNGELSTNTTVNVGGLSNVSGTTDGTINIDGGPTSQQTGLANEALLNVSAQAGFGTNGQLIGDVNLYQDGQIQFTSGQINQINSGSELTLNGAFAAVSNDGSDPNGPVDSNSALTGLNTVAGSLSIENGNAVATSGDLSNSDFIGVDNGGYTGGSSLTVGLNTATGAVTGALTNTGTLDVGNGNLSSETTVSVGSITNFATSTNGTTTYGTINVDGSAISTQTGLANEGLLQVSGAAGFGNAGEVDGNVNLYQDGQIQFASGTEIKTIASGSELTLNGANAAIANDGSDSNSALTGLTSVAGSFYIQNGAAVATGSAMAAANTLTIGNTLTDTAYIQTTNLDIAAGGTFDFGSGGSLSSAVTFAGTSKGNATLAIDATPNNGSTFGNALVNFGDDDDLDLKGLTYGTGASATYSNGVLSVTSDGVTENFNVTNPGATQYYAHQDNTGGTVVNDSATVCFASGTLIRTERGREIVDVAVEALEVGDRCVTTSGAARPIKWLGHRTIACAGHAAPAKVQPIRVSAHAFGPNKPARDLYVSPGHCLCVDVLGEVLIPAEALVNGSTVAQVEVEEVTYWHVELDSHDVVLAENLPCESYLDMGNRDFFAEGDVVRLDATPDARPADVTHADYCRPYHDGGPIIEAVRAQMRAHAGGLGWHLTQTLDMHLEVDGRRIEPVLDEKSARFLLPADARDVWIVAPSARPHDTLGAWDWRELGIDVTAMHVDDGVEPPRDIAADDPLLDIGFHAAEDGHRWTSGRARLPAAFWAGCQDAFVLCLDLGGPPVARWATQQTAEAESLRAAA